MVKQIVRNLNRELTLIYPIPETRRSNFRHRPIGLGVQVWLMYLPLKMGFDSEEAAVVNKKILKQFITIFN